LKNIVYSKTSTTSENMMERITLACRSIPRNVFLSTVDSFERRVQLCVDKNRYFILIKMIILSHKK